MTDESLEAPEADAVEQETDAGGDVDDDAEPEQPLDVPLESDAADAADQAREVELDDDEGYR